MIQHEKLIPRTCLFIYAHEKGVAMPSLAAPDPQKRVW